MVFMPAEVNAKAGDTIVWDNKDILVTARRPKGAWELTIPSRATASTVVNEVGTIDYYCRFHPNMRGRIAVTR